MHVGRPADRGTTVAGLTTGAVLLLAMMSCGRTNAVAHEGSLVVSATPTSHDLLAAPPRELTRWLDTARPAPVAIEERARILRALPREGEVTDLDAASREKLRALAPLLRATQRDSVYVIKVIDAAQAAVGLHARAVVLISRQALHLLAADELQAIVAHEIGHEYVWTAFEDASRPADHARLHDLEIVCDVVAILTVRTLGGNPSRLFSGLEKLSRFNRERFGAALNESTHPPLAGRRALGEFLAARLRRASLERAGARAPDGIGIGGEIRGVNSSAAPRLQASMAGAPFDPRLNTTPTMTAS